MIDLETGLATFLGMTVDDGDIEAAEFDPASEKLFAINDDIFGTINQSTGDFTGSIDLGTCEFEDGSTRAINDADGLAKDITTGDWYGTARFDPSSGPEVNDALFKLQLDGLGEPFAPIDPEGFGTSPDFYSCVYIDTLSLPNDPDLVDDIGIDQATGKLYGIANGGATTPTRIIEINKVTGAVTDLGRAETPAGVFIPDIEGFSIDEDGNWLLSTGKDGNQPATDNTILRLVDTPTGPFPADLPAVFVADIGSVNIMLNGNADGEFDPTLGYWDWEALSCYNVSNVTASIGDYTWLDTDGNGLQDSGEPPAPGIDVTLKGTTDGTIGDGDDWTVGTLQTDTNGNYTFPVPPGDYYLEFDDGRTYTLLNQGGDPALDSDANPSSPIGQTVITTLDKDEHDTTWDAGLVAASVGDRVWLDKNENGLQDSGEPGVAGIEVELYAAGDTPGSDLPVATTTTDVNGNYGFTVEPGDYFIRFDPAQEYTTQNAGGDGTIDSDPDPTTGVTAGFTLAAGANDTSWDAGLVPATLGDFVWYDSNTNGIQDGGEPGVAGVKVELFDVGADGVQGGTDDTLIETTYTDADGAYGFSVEPGTYYVRFNPALSFTTAGAGDDDEDSDANKGSATGRSQDVTLAAGEDNPDIDAGLVQVAVIGDKVFSDLDADGVQDVGELGVDGVTVNLYKPGPDGVPGGGDDIPAGTTTTAGGGLYSFTVAPGDYFIEFVAPAGNSFSPTNQTTDDLDSDADVSTGRTPVTTLDPGETDNTWDAGIYDVPSGDGPGSVAIGNRVWHDLNKDGIRDAGEPGIPGVTVELYAAGDTAGSDTPVATTVTDGDGRYLFALVDPGDYFVAIDANDAALSSTPYSSPGGGQDPDTSDHPDANGDDGTVELSTGYVISADITVSYLGQSQADIEDPVNMDDASAYMTVDFGFTAEPTAIALGRLSVQTPFLLPLLVVALLPLLGISVLIILRKRSAGMGV